MVTTLADLTADHIGRLIEVDDSMLSVTTGEVVHANTRSVQLLDYRHTDTTTLLLDGSDPKWPAWIEWATCRTVRVLS